MLQVSRVGCVTVVDPADQLCLNVLLGCRYLQERVGWNCFNESFE